MAKIKAIKHDESDAVEAGAYGAIRGGLGGALLLVGGAALVGALVVGGLTFGGTALSGYLFGEGAKLAVGDLSLKLVTGAAVTGGILGGLISAPFAGAAAGVGGLLGLLKGTSRISRENAKYREKTQEVDGSRQAEMVQVHNQALQMGFAAGQQQGAQMVMQQLQQHAAQEQQQAAASAPAPIAEEKPMVAGKSFAAAETQRREQAAAAAVAGASIA